MSPSKSKSKSSARAAKEQQKASTKPSTTPANSGNGAPASAYNPVSGTFHSLETTPTASSPPQNGRFRNIDETDVHSGGSLGTGLEDDSSSSNGSCSGESEDQKEKSATVTLRLEIIPGSDNDKRDKIRQKNGRKHQRQRERRAQELHERCSGYLMSRKLEALAQQLVAMGFPSERATMALILNEGRVEESVAWLFEGGEEGAEQKDTNLHTGGNLKIDITEELARIKEIETKYRCTKQEVERFVVSCEGDLDKAAEILRLQKQEPASALLKMEGTGDPPAIDGGKQAVNDAQTPMRTLVKSVASVTIQPRKDERDFNYTKVAPAVVPAESGTRNLQPLRSRQPKSEWAKTQGVSMPVDKRWPNMSSSPPVSYSLASPLQVTPPPAKGETRYVVLGSEGKSLPAGSVREPVIMMQRPQTASMKQSPATGPIATPTTAGWYPGSVASVEVMKANGGTGHIPIANLTSSNVNTQQILQQQQYHHPFTSSSVEPGPAGWGTSWSQSGTNSSGSLSVPSSLGLFTGWSSTGTSGSSSSVDWSTGGLMPQCDYNNIDWSLEATSSRQSDLWMGLASCVKTSRMYDGCSVSTAAAKGTVPDVSSSGSHEWTSPFALRDIFTLPRQFVTSPSQ
eukprot:TRINITY_DN147_c0_g1_i1.p1 TRINITY_DN147_c0_g1~~TRINITY_DN147_c0_g1_i1.p1  ORF type:complete len:626 (-),score=147.66 TRINITY_DN147_c0_g1_i1:643-2520(-)